MCDVLVSQSVYWLITHLGYHFITFFKLEKHNNKVIKMKISTPEAPMTHFWIKIFLNKIVCQV